ncbi:MAG TPA: glycosyltransferase [Burkholderiaceae bacterium]|nr:glycosyltransferase [Burkholderiaceae bacterium]
MPKIIAFTRQRHQSGKGNLQGDVGTENLPEYAQPQEQERADDGILVSVVVPTCGRPQLLSRCLVALILQRFDKRRFEIIVVDDASDENTREVVARWATHAERGGPSIGYIPSQGPHGPAAARNRGWRAARGSVIAFTDDDTVARIDWLEKALRTFEANQADAVWGRIVMPLHRTPTDYELDAKGLERAEFVTANCLCRKAVLERLDGFDERFRFAWREDTDLYFRLLDSSARIVHAPAAVVVHPIRPAGWGVSLAQQKKVLFDALLFKKHPELYRKKIRARPCWDYYVIVCALATWLPAVAFGAPRIAAAAGGIWALLTARFCLKRLGPTVKTPSHIGEMIVTSALIPPISVFWRLVGAVRFRTRFM